MQYDVVRDIIWRVELVPHKPNMVKELVVANQVVRLISGGEQLMLDACDGKRTIVRASDIFVHIGSHFKNWYMDIAGKATPKTSMAVYEIIEDVNFVRMFTSLSGDVNRLVLTQDQILNFIEKYRNWLRQDDWATFFFFSVGDELFVALTRIFFDGKVRVSVRRFGYGGIWLAFGRQRLVIPQL